MTKNNVDTWLLRTKDGLLVLGVVGGFFVWGIKMVNLPLEVKALAEQQKEEGHVLNSHDRRLSQLEDNISFIKEGIAELKTKEIR